MKYGWNKRFEQQFETYKEKGYIVGRVICSERYKYTVVTDLGVLDAEVSGRFRYKASRHKDYPSVGDWVALAKMTGQDSGIIHGLLERENAFTRKMPISGGRKIRGGRIVGGTPEEQVLAANVNIAFIVMSVDDNFNINRMERYLTLAYNAGVRPVIILNKVDVVEDVTPFIDAIKAIAFGVDIHGVSAIDGSNMSCFDTYLQQDQTVVFFGSSGVGKSTITNYLMGGASQKTSHISHSNGKGRHTTSTSQLLLHPSGGMVIDTPGLRELQLWCDESALDKNFEDVIDLIDQCKFRDCKHDTEVGCAIKAALEDGRLAQSRYDSYVDQFEEVSHNSKARRMAEIQYNKCYGRMDKK